MWTALFPNWKTYKLFLIHPAAKEILDKLFTQSFTLNLTKKCASHLFFTLTFFNEQRPSLCLKLYFKRFFKKNRPKNFLKTYFLLKKWDIPLISPILVFYHSSIKAFFYKAPFIGGIILPFLSQGFLEERTIMEDAKKEKPLLTMLIHFIFRLHEKGIFMKDTKYNNFFYDKMVGFKIFDLDGVKIYKKPLSLRDRLKDLAPLAMSLEWIGLSDSDTFIFKTYQTLYPFLSDQDFLLFKNLIRKSLYKRIRKFKFPGYKEDNRVYSEFEEE